MCVYILMFILALKLVSSQIEIPIKEYVDIILDTRRYYRENNCVFLITSGEQEMVNHRKVTEIVRLLSHNGVAGVNVHVALMHRTDLLCTSSRPLNVILTSDRETQSAMARLNKISSRPRWLMFVGDFPEKHFTNVYVPFDCDFLLAERHNVVVTIKPLFELYEIYKVGERSPLTIKQFGTWSAEFGVTATKLSLRMRRTDLQGYTIKALAKQELPFVTKTPIAKNKLKLGGYMGDIWTTLEKQTNFTTEIIPIEGMRSVLLPNGTWTGLFALLQHNQVDMCINELSLTRIRMDVIDYLFPVRTSYQRVFIKSPSMTNLRWNNFLAPFTLYLWVSILGFILCLGAMLYVVENVGQRCQVHDAPAAHGLVEYILFMHGFCCQQGHDTTPQAISGRIVYIIGALTSCILMAAYSAVLISFISVQTTVFPVNNFEELVADGRYKLGIIGGSGFYTEFEKSSVPWINSVYTKLILPYKENLPKNDSEGLKRICSVKHYSYMTTLHMSSELRRTLRCSISPLPDISISRLNAMAIVRGSPYKELINFYLLCLRQSGSLKRSILEYWPPEQEDRRDDFRSVSLRSTIPIFTVCLSGLVFGPLVLIIEICVHRFCSYLRPRKTQQMVKVKVSPQKPLPFLK